LICINAAVAGCRSHRDRRALGRRTACAAGR